MNVTVSKSGKSRNQRRKANRKKAAAVNVNVQAQSGGGRRRNRRSRRRNSPAVDREYTYLDTLMNPQLVAGVKIPDIVAFQTGTFQLTADGYLLGQATPGDSVGLLIKPIVGTAGAVFPIVTSNGGAAGGIGTTSNVNWTSTAAVAALYGGFRPVSMVAELEFVGASTNDAGTLWASLVPKSGAYANPATVAIAQAYPNTEIVPLRNGIRILWKPEDQSDFVFNDAAGTGHTYPYLFLGATGILAAQIQLSGIRYHITANFEATALVDTVNIVHTEPSPFNMNSLRGAFEWASQVGNNIATLYSNAGPYLAAGGTVAGALGYQVPSWVPQMQRPARRSRIRN